MYRAGSVYLLKTITPIHSGVGESIVEASDLPLQRDKLGIPIINGSSLKGGLRSRLKREINVELVKLLFGSEPDKTPLESGSVAVLDALPILVPIRSLFGGWAYVTSPWLLFAFSNRLDMVDDVGGASEVVMALALESLKLKGDEALAPNALTGDVDGEEVVVLLDEYVLRRKKPGSFFDSFVKILSDFIEENVGDRVVVVSDEVIKVFLSRGMRIQQRVKLTGEKIVEHGPWGEEQIPPDTIMHFSFLCSESRVKVKKKTILSIIELGCDVGMDKDGNVDLKPKNVRDILERIVSESLFFVIGGDESVGRGVVEIRKFKVNGDIDEGVKLPVRVEMPEPDSVELMGSISDSERLKIAYERLRERVFEEHEDYVKELQGLPTLLAQCGVQPTYFYYRYKGKKNEKEGEWWVWKDLSDRIRKLIEKDLEKDKILNPLKLILLEWDLMKFTAQLKRISGIKREGGKNA